MSLFQKIASGALTGTAIASGDLPGTISSNTTGTAANITATSNATLTTLSALTTASALVSIGTITTGVWNGTTIAIANGGTGQTSASTAFNALSPITTLGDLIYGSGTNTNARLAGNTTSAKQFLTQTGTGTVSAAPAWAAIASADLPTITLTGNVTGSASGGSIATTIGSNVVTNAMLAQMAANTVKANNTGSTANATDVSLVSTATASSVMYRDTNANTLINAITQNSATTATAAGTTTLTVSSAPFQQFTGTTTQTVTLPNATTLTNGFQYQITNRSTGVVTVNANGGGLLQAMAAATQATYTLISNGTSAGTWDISYTGAATGGGGSGMAAGGASTKSANYTLVTGDAGKVFLAQSNGGAFNFTLPAASSGYVFTIKDSQGTFGTNNVTLVRAASESIEGVAASFIMSANWGSWTFFCDGTNWFIIAH